MHFLYNEIDFFESLADNFQMETDGYSAWFCPQRSLSCLLAVTMGQNLLSMFTTLKIQSVPVEGNVFANSNSTHPQSSSGTFLCASIDIASGGFSSQSGVSNGIETIIDLETYDNGDKLVTEDGADIQVTDPGDYPLAQLKGFSVSPGYAVQVHIRPSLYGITEEALEKFDYLGRNCVEQSVDKELNDLYGMVGDYTLSNCLVSLTEVNILKR